MLTKTKNVMLGSNGFKGVLARSGIITAVCTTVFVVIEGWSAGDVPGRLMAYKSVLLPMWVAAITALLVSKSKKANA